MPASATQMIARVSPAGLGSSSNYAGLDSLRLNSYPEAALLLYI